MKTPLYYRIEPGVIIIENRKDVKLFDLGKYSTGAIPITYKAMHSLILAMDLLGFYDPKNLIKPLFDNLQEYQNKRIKWKENAYDFNITSIDGYQLRGYQKKNLYFTMNCLNTYGFCLNFDEQRTGKSIITACLIEKFKYAKNVIVVELAGVKNQIASDFKKWQSGKHKIFVINEILAEDKEKTFDKYLEYNGKKILIANYEFFKPKVSEIKKIQKKISKLSKDVTKSEYEFNLIRINELEEELKLEESKPLSVEKGGKIKEFDLLVLDEPHKKVKNKKTANFVYVNGLRKKCKYVFILTGTPIANTIVDSFTLMHLCSPKMFKYASDFYGRYFKYEGEEVNVTTKLIQRKIFVPKIIGWKRKNELLMFINSFSTNTKRLEEPELKWMPNVKHLIEDVMLQLDTKQEHMFRQAYNDFEISFVNKKKEYQVLDIQTKGSLIMRERQIMVSPGAIEIMEQPVDSPKTKWTIEYLKANPNKNILIFSTFTHFLKKFKKHLEKLNINCELICGSTNDLNKYKYKEAYQNGEIKVLLLNIQSGGTGLTLDKTDTSIFLNNDWMPSDNDQAYDRLIPTTPDKVKPQKIYRLFMEGTYEIELLKMIETKQELSKLFNNNNKEYKRLIDKQRNSFKEKR